MTNYHRALQGESPIPSKRSQKSSPSDVIIVGENRTTIEVVEALNRKSFGTSPVKPLKKSSVPVQADLSPSPAGKSPSGALRFTYSIFSVLFLIITFCNRAHCS